MGMNANTANLPIAAGGEREPLATGAPRTATTAFSAATTAPRASHRFGPIDMMRGAAPSDTAAAAAAAAAKVPRRLDSADLALLSSDGGSSRSSSSSNATADDGGWGSYQDSSKRKGFSLGQVPAFVGQDYGDEDWREEHHQEQQQQQQQQLDHRQQDHDGPANRHGRLPKPLFQDGGSYPSPQSTDTARISSSSLGTFVACLGEGEEERRRWTSQDDRHGQQQQQQQQRPCSCTLSAVPCNERQARRGSGWEPTGEGVGVTRERQTLRAKHRRRQERAREEAAAALLVGVDSDGAAAAAAAAPVDPAAGDGDGGKAPSKSRSARSRRSRIQPPRPSAQGAAGPDDARAGGGSGGGGDEGSGAEGDSHDDAIAVVPGGQRVRLSAQDFHTPVRRPASCNFATTPVAEAAAEDASAGGKEGRGEGGASEGGQGGCERCDPSGASGGGEAEESAGVPGGRAAGGGRFGQTAEMEVHRRSADPRPRSTAHSFALSTSSISSSGRGARCTEKRRSDGTSGAFSRGNSRRLDDSSSSSSMAAATAAAASLLREESLRTTSLRVGAGGAVGGRGVGEPRHSDLTGTFRTASLRNTSSTGTGSLRLWKHSSSSSERRRRRGLLGGLKKGVGLVWDKIAADHPEPLPVEKALTKEEQKAKHLQREIERRNDWHTNSVAEQYVLQNVLLMEEVKITR